MSDIVPSPKVSPSAYTPRTGKAYRSFAESVRRVLESRKVHDIDPKTGRTKVEQIIENLYRIAKSRSHKQAVAAAQLLLARAYGLPKPSDEALEAVREGGVRLVVVSDPELAQIAEGKALPAPKPEFIEAEVIE